MMSPLGELRQKTLTALPASRRLADGGWIDRATSREQYVDWVSGACLLVRRHAAEQAGLLDERYFLYAEDVDFCAAIRAQGHRVLFTPAAEIVHVRGRSRATAPAAANEAYRRSHLAFYEKHHPRWAPVLRVICGSRASSRGRIRGRMKSDQSRFGVPGSGFGVLGSWFDVSGFDIRQSTSTHPAEYNTDAGPGT